MEPDLLAHATEFSFLPAGASFGDQEVHYFTVTVARRSNDLWAVLWTNQCWNKKTRSWEYEPSDRSKRFLRECRFTLEDAEQIARSHPDELTVNGKSWLDFKAIHAQQKSTNRAAAAGRIVTYERPLTQGEMDALGMEPGVSFGEATKEALSEDPDVVLFGNLGDFGFSPASSTAPVSDPSS